MYTLPLCLYSLLEDNTMIIFEGDWILPVNSTGTAYTEVIDIVGPMTVYCSDGQYYTADESDIASVLSAREYRDMVNAVYA